MKHVVHALWADDSGEVNVISILTTLVVVATVIAVVAGHSYDFWSLTLLR